MNFFWWLKLQLHHLFCTWVWLWFWLLVLALYSRSSWAFLIHKGEEQTHGGGDEGVHGLIQEFGRKHAPDEEVVSETGDQNHVEHDWDGA